MDPEEKLERDLEIYKFKKVMRSETKQLLTAAEKHIHRMFLAGMVFAAISCFARSDFNMPLFGFLYLMWDKDDVSRVD